MKTIQTLLTVLLVCVAFGCNNANREKNLEDASININDNTDATQTSPDQTAMDPNAQRSVSNDEMTALYSQLQMTPEQIERFENENKSFRDSVGNLNYGQSSQMDSGIKKILTPAQFREYETWRDKRHNIDTNNDNTSQEP